MEHSAQPCVSSAEEHRASPDRCSSRQQTGYNRLRNDSGAFMSGINLAERLDTFADHWHPKTVGQFNGHDLMVVKVKGEFVWHKHDDTDDFFLVLKGRLTIQLRAGNVVLGP